MYWNVLDVNRITNFLRSKKSLPMIRKFPKSYSSVGHLTVWKNYFRWTISIRHVCSSGLWSSAILMIYYLNFTLKTEKQSFNISNLRLATLVRILDDNLHATPICIKCGHAKDLHKFSNITHDYYECTSATRLLQSSGRMMFL